MTAASPDLETVKIVVRRVAPKFFSEGHERVYVAICCGRAFVGPNEVAKCKTCDGVPEGFWVTPDTLHEICG